MTGRTLDLAGPEQADVDALRGLLDLLGDFSGNDQRARYLLTCNWMRDRGAAAAARLQSGCCPGWCLGDHDDDFHRSAVTGSWVSETVMFGEQQPISVYLEAFINEAGATRAPQLVIDGKVSESQDLAEFSLGDAVRLAAAVSAALQAAGVEVPS